jgi:hypothetical protein
MTAKITEALSLDYMPQQVILASILANFNRPVF